MKNLKYLGLELTFQDIIAMSKRKYKELIKERIQKLALKYLYAHQIFFLLTKYFSAAPIALPGGTTEISDIFDVLAGGEDEGTVRYSTVHYSTIQYSAVQHYWFTGSCWGLTGRTPR